VETAYYLAGENMQTLGFRQKERYNLKVHGDKFTPGQLMWLCNPLVLKGKSKTLLALAEKDK